MNNAELFCAFRSELDAIVADDVLNISTVKEIYDEGEKVGLLILQNFDTYIDGLFILPEHRRKGLGRKAVLEFVEEYDMPEELHIIKKNKVAQKFWESIFELEEITSNEIDRLYRIVGLAKKEKP